MRFYLFGHTKRTYGPLEWTSVRELFAFGLIDGYLACEVGAQKWEPVGSFSKITALPKTVSNRVAQYSTFSVLSDLTSVQVEMLVALKAPPFTRKVNHYVVNLMIRLLAEGQSDPVDPKLSWIFAAEREHGWKMDPASLAQKEVLKKKGVEFPSWITKGEASCLISSSEATRPQIRRLRFYGCSHIPGITKAEAAALIDDYKARFPETEPEYQKWKLGIQ